MQQDSGSLPGVAEVAARGRSAERLIVCVSSNPESVRAIEAASRLALASSAEWSAVHVESPSAVLVPDGERDAVSSHLRMAERLGADTIRLGAEDAPGEVLAHAKKIGASALIVGRPRASSPGGRGLRKGFLSELLERADGIDVYVVGAGERSGQGRRPGWLGASTKWRGYAVALGVAFLATVVADLLFGRGHVQDVVMVYLLGIVLVSVGWGHRPAILSAVLSVLALDFVFVPPYLTFEIADPRSVVTFVVLFVVAVGIIGLTKRVRDQATEDRQRETRTARLYALSRELSGTSSISEILAVAVRHLHKALDAEVAVLLPDTGGRLAPATMGPHTFILEGTESEISDWVWNHQQSAGLLTDRFPASKGAFMLLRGSRGRVGVLGVRPERASNLADPEHEQLLSAFAAQVASAVERCQLAEGAQRVQLEVETERLRSSLLSSVSHDLRTPLGVIKGATSTLLQTEASLAAAARKELLESVHEEADRLNRLVGNLLDMTRLASGALRPKKEWHPIDEIVGVALNRLEDRLCGREVHVTLPRDLPPVPLDAVLVEQVVINLLLPRSSDDVAATDLAPSA
jgi:two-component system sensor histidine kinase KdpD